MQSLKHSLETCLVDLLLNFTSSPTWVSRVRGWCTIYSRHTTRFLFTRKETKAGSSLVLMAVLFCFAGCGPVAMPPPPGWSPMVPVVIGARIDDGDLIVSTGRNCPAGTEIGIQPVRGVDVFEATALVALNRINVTHPGDDLSVLNSAINTLDWSSDLGLLRAGARLPDGRKTWAVQPELSLVNLVDSSLQYPADQYYWGGSFGWLTPEQIQARDGVDLLTICTPV